MKSNARLPRRCPGRPRRSQEEIDAVLRRYRLSGLSLLAFAREHDLCYATLLRWRRRSGAADGDESPTGSPAPSPAFIPVELETATPGGEFVLEWAPGQSLRIPSGFDPGELRRLLDVLGVRP